MWFNFDKNTIEYLKDRKWEIAEWLKDYEGIIKHKDDILKIDTFMQKVWILITLGILTIETSGQEAQVELKYPFESEYYRLLPF